MRVFVTMDDDGHFRAASVNNPIECMKIIERNEQLSDSMEEQDIQPEDMINFEDFLGRLTGRGVAELVEVNDY